MYDRYPIKLDKNQDINKRTAHIDFCGVRINIDVADLTKCDELAIITDTDGTIYTTSFNNVLIIEERKSEENDRS